MGRLTTLAYAISLVACTTPTAFERPQGDLPTAWPTGGIALLNASASSAAAPASSLPWQTYFTDPRLQALIALALENNRDLRIAAAKVEQDRAQYRIARADRLPTVNLQLDQTGTYTTSSLASSASSRRYDVQGLLSWELDFWGRVASLSESAKANFLATEHARREVYLSLIAEVARSYFSLLEKDDLIDLGTIILRTREQTLEIATQGTRLGGADEDERQQAMVGVESARSSLAQLQHERNMTVNQLNFLVGRVAPDLPAGRPLSDQDPGVTLAAGLPSEVLLRRPDVMAAEQRLRAANADIDAARAAFLPKIMLTAALGLASPALAGLFSSGAYSYQPVLSLPIFDGGRTAANADVAKARQVMAVAEYEKTLQQAFREVADQLSARGSIQAQLDSALVGQRALGARLKMARSRYDIGLSSYREVLEAQRGLLTARQSTIALRRMQQDAAATLYKVLGSGADAVPATAVSVSVASAGAGASADVGAGAGAVSFASAGAVASSGAVTLSSADRRP